MKIKIKNRKINISFNFILVIIILISSIIVLCQKNTLESYKEKNSKLDKQIVEVNNKEKIYVEVAQKSQELSQEIKLKILKNKKGVKSSELEETKTQLVNEFKEKLN